MEEIILALQYYSVCVIDRVTSIALYFDKNNKKSCNKPLKRVMLLMQKCVPVPLCFSCQFSAEADYAVSRVGLP